MAEPRLAASGWPAKDFLFPWSIAHPRQVHQGCFLPLPPGLRGSLRRFLCPSSYKMPWAGGHVPEDHPHLRSSWDLRYAWPLPRGTAPVPATHPRHLLGILSTQFCLSSRSSPGLWQLTCYFISRGRSVKEALVWRKCLLLFFPPLCDWVSDPLPPWSPWGQAAPWLELRDFRAHSLGGLCI